MGPRGSPPNITLEDTLAVFEQLDPPSTPLTAAEASKALGCTRRTAYGKLEELADRGEILSKKTGARSRAWWRPVDVGTADEPEAPSGPTDPAERREYERELRGCETAIQNVRDGVYVTDADRRYAMVNDAYLDIIGMAREQVIGADVSTIVGEEATERSAAVIEDMLADERETGRVEGHHHGMTDRDVENWYTLLPLEDGEFAGTTGVVRDVTERVEYERELKRYETLIEESTDVSAILDPDGTIEYVTPSVNAVLGYATDDLVGENAFEYIHADDHEGVAEEFAALVERSGSRHAVEFRFRDADGGWVWLEARGRNLLDDPMIGGLVVYTRDVTERKCREQLLERQREQLAALNGLNTVVQEITHAVIESSTREEIERLVCEGLAGADSYRGAWTGSVDLEDDRVIVRAEAAADGSLDERSLSAALDETGTDLFEQIVRFGTVQVVQELAERRDDDPWLAYLYEHGIRSSAAIPIRYEDSLYGILNVYSERPDAFDDVERSIVGRLGDVIGHTINAVERRRALTSDEIVELEFRVTDVFGAMGVTETAAGKITFDRTIPVGDGAFLEYGTVTDDAVDALDALLEELPHFESLEVFDESADESRFELRLSAPPAIAAIAAHGGKVQSATIEGGDYTMVAHVPPGGDIHQLVGTVQDTYPAAEVLALRQMVRPDADHQPVESVLNEELTDRQRSVLDAAYFAGFFETPRDRSGKEIAESLGISASTFHEHIRVGERKLLCALLE